MNFKNLFKTTKYSNIDKLNEFFNHTLKRSEGILTLQEPKVFSMSEETNIASKYTDQYIATKDGNLCAGFKLEGVSYSAATLEKEAELVQTRNRFWSKLDNNVEVNIFCKKEKIQLEFDSSSKNLYAEEIIKKWESGIVTYKINYYLFISTKSKQITGYFEAKKQKMTTEDVAEISRRITPRVLNSKLKNLMKFAMRLKARLENSSQKHSTQMRLSISLPHTPICKQQTCNTDMKISQILTLLQMWNSKKTILFLHATMGMKS